jgi:hypothetical protein
LLRALPPKNTSARCSTSSAAAVSFVTARQRGRGLADERPAAVALGTHDFQRRTIRRSDLKAILKLM